MFLSRKFTNQVMKGCFYVYFSKDSKSFSIVLARIMKSQSKIGSWMIGRDFNEMKASMNQHIYDCYERLENYFKQIKIFISLESIAGSCCCLKRVHKHFYFHSLLFPRKSIYIIINFIYALWIKIELLEESTIIFYGYIPIFSPGSIITPWNFFE